MSCYKQSEPLGLLYLAAALRRALILANAASIGLRSGECRQIEDFGARGLYGLADAIDLVARQIIHDDNVAVPQGWAEDLLDIGGEALTIDRPFDHQGSGQAVHAQGGDEGGDLPMAVGHIIDQPLATPAATIAARHGRGLVDIGKADLEHRHDLARLHATIQRQQNTIPQILRIGSSRSRHRSSPDEIRIAMNHIPASTGTPEIQVITIPL